MTDRPGWDVIAEFYSPARGGRARAPDLTTGVYRPHIVIKDDPEQTYLGICFTQGPEPCEIDTEIAARIEALFQHMDYSGLTPETRFLIKEGHRTVGEGVVV